MNEQRIAVGAMMWYLGVLVPVIHHAVLYATTTKEGIEPARLVAVLGKSLPVFDWLYFAAMAVAGTVVLVSGIRNKS